MKVQLQNNTLHAGYFFIFLSPADIFQNYFFSKNPFRKTIKANLKNCWFAVYRPRKLEVGRSVGFSFFFPYSKSGSSVGFFFFFFFYIEICMGSTES